MTNEIKVTATVRQIMDAELWDEYCNLTGCNPRAMNEGQIDKGETVDVPFNLVGRLIEWGLKQKPRGSFPKRTKLYLHGDKDNQREKGEELGLEGEALRMFAHALYEVEFDVEVDEDGTCRIIAVNGKPLVSGRAA